YPQVLAERARIEELVRGEEERFAETLDSGMRRIKEYLEVHDRDRERNQSVDERGRTVDGGFLFTLYDTYGFPRDLAEDVLKERGWVVTDETQATWDAEMNAQRERARAGATFDAGDEVEAGALYQRIGAEIPPTQFVGYESLTSPARIMALVRGTQRLREVAQ